MASTPDKLKARWDTFSKESSLEVIVARPSAVRPSEICSLSHAEADRLPTRQHLFFDERLSIHIILRSKEIRAVVEEWIPHLQLSVTAHASNADARDGVNPASTKYDLSTVRVDGTDKAALQVVGPTCNVIWPATLHMTRPRARLQRPTVYFTASLALSKQVIEDAVKLKPDYMTSYEPSPANVLEALRTTPGLGDVYLSEQRITKVAPVLQQDTGLKVLRGSSKRAYPAIAALLPRLQCFALPQSTMATLHVQASPQLESAVRFGDVELAVEGQVVKSLDNESRRTIMQPGDEQGIVFEVAAAKKAAAGQLHTAHVHVEAKATIAEDDQADLDIRWQLPFDSRSVDGTTYHSWTRIGQRGPAKAGQSKSEPVTFTFTAPASVNIGQVFRLQVSCVNHSSRVRNFSILPQPEDVLVHTPVVKLRAVAPGACFEADVQYTANHSGSVDFGRIEIVDVDSQSAFYAEELPDVIAVINDA